MFNVNDNSKIVLKGLKNLKISKEQTKKLMMAISEDMKTKVDFRFKQSKDPNGKPWEPLSETTISRRRKRSSKQLVDSGQLRTSISAKATSDTAIVGTNKEYATTQNFGANKGEFGTTQIRETVREHTRRRRGKTENVRAHTRRRAVSSPWGNIPSRKYLGFSNNQKTKYATYIRGYLLNKKGVKL